MTVYCQEAKHILNTKLSKDMFGLVYGALHHFQQFFSYIVAVSFIGGGHRRKQPTCHNHKYKTFRTVQMSN